ncbi:MAG: DNA-binding protein [Elusimicrobia bacterium]|nr:DNA-binding protein [Elusimicrobiota bacterium]
MHSQEKPYLTGRTFLFSIHKGEDLLQALQHFCHHNQIRCAAMHGIGAAEKATFAVYDQKAKKYVKLNVDKELEIVSLNGNISIFDDKPIIHCHAAFSDMEGRAYGGHLMAGTKIFSCEVFIQELTGDVKTRKMDKATQLPLWLNPFCIK